MTAPVIDETAPEFANDVDNDVIQMRDNTIYLLMMAAGAGYLLPQWETTANGPNLAAPTDIEMIHADGRKMRFQFTWSSDRPATINYQVDKGLGAGYEEIALGTLTLSYDGDGNFSKAVPS